MTIEQQISNLLAELANSNNTLGSRSNQSRTIRRKLRKLGHRGGLRGTR